MIVPYQETRDTIFSVKEQISVALRDREPPRAFDRRPRWIWRTVCSEKSNDVTRNQVPQFRPFDPRFYPPPFPRVATTVCSRDFDISVSWSTQFFLSRLSPLASIRYHGAWMKLSEKARERFRW